METYDAYIVIFSITDRTSFQTAIDYLYDIKNRKTTKRPIILIANKIDLVRKRKVSKEGMDYFKLVISLHKKKKKKKKKKKSNTFL